MDYTIHQLRVFMKVAEYGSITRAAEELHLSQPAVSIQLRNFQEQFEIPLTEVIGRKLYVTAFGKEIAHATERILNEIDTVNQKTMSYRGQLTGTLRVSVVSTGKYIMPFFLSGFLKQQQGVDLKLDVTNKSSVIRSLEMNEVDFSLVSVMPDNLSLHRLELMQNKLYLVGNSESPFNQKTHDRKIIETIPLIYREPGSATRHAMEQFIIKNKLQVRKKMELTSNEAVKQAVISGMGYSVMPLIGIKNELKLGDLKIITVKGFPMKSTWNLVWLKGKKFSPVAAAFLDYLKKEKENIIKEKFNWTEMAGR